MRSIHDPRYQHLIKKLIELRESKNVTQVELARRLGKPQSYVSKVEILEFLQSKPAIIRLYIK